MDEDILSDIQYGRCEILRDVLPWWWDMQSSYILGTRFVDWLVSLDLDSELCVDSERAYLEGSPESGNKRIVLERNWEQKWVLGFEWVFDHQIPGYSLLSEYTVLVVEDTWGRTEWPVYGSGYWSAPGTPSAQFKRRMAVKERKERARLGRKQPRSRIPGAWKW
ncbi:hypothetical protein AA0118_g5033 [Alternaria tenuissima]|nr:hypothetical protein AA0118_g5033 [Alternaria tenuissima]